MASTKDVTVTKVFGLTHAGATALNINENTKYASKYELEDDASVTKLSVLLYISGSEGNYIAAKGFIYEDNNGAPGALIATTEETTVEYPGSPDWGLRELSFANPVSLDAGTYWIGFFYQNKDGSPTIQVKYDSGDTNQWAENSDTYDDGPSDPFGTPTYYARKLCIFATYTTTLTMRYPPSITGSVVATVSRRTAIRWQEKSFYAAGRYWVFYIDRESTGNYPVYYTSSEDAETWETPVEIKKALEFHGECLQAILDDDGYVHVFIRASAGAATRIYYRRGQPNSDGTITWTADWATAWEYTGNNCDFYACIDSYGYPWISWTLGSNENGQTKVTKSSRNDGIWETEDGYPVLVDTDYAGKYHNNNFIVPLSNGKVFVFYFMARQDGGPAADGKIYGRLWNGSSWGDEEQCTTSEIIQQYGSPGYETWSRGVAVDDDDNIHLVFLTRQPYGYAFSWDIKYVKRTWGESWGTEQTVVEDVMYKNASPGIVKVGDDFRVYWTSYPSPNIIYIKKLKANGNWSSTLALVDETTDTIPNEDVYGYDGVINPFAKLFEGKLGLMWITGSSGNYKIKFGLSENLGSPGYKPKNYTIDNRYFKQIKKTFERSSNASFEVTRSALSFGERDPVTGWYEKNYTESTIDMIIITRDAQKEALQLGCWVNLDALGLTDSQVEVGDLITDDSDTVWEVKAVKPIKIGDKVKFFKCDLKELPLYA